MTKIFVNPSSEPNWSTLENFLEDAFSLVYDIDPLESILVLKITDPSGYYLKLCVDGDLFWTIYVYDENGEQVDSIQRQGTIGTDQIPFEQFVEKLNKVLQQYAPNLSYNQIVKTPLSELF